MDNQLCESPSSEEKKLKNLTNREILLTLLRKVSNLEESVTKLEESVSKMDNSVSKMVASVKMIKRIHGYMTSKVEIGSSTVKALLGVPERTLSRWRSDNKIAFEARKDGLYSYRFGKLYTAIKSGELRGKQLDQLNALTKLEEYYERNILGFETDEENDQQ